MNENGVLDPGEDQDGDEELDKINEDKNGNGNLDKSEDLDGDGNLDVNEDKNGNGRLDPAETYSRRLLTGSADNNVKLWDTKRVDGSQLAKQILSLVGHSREVTSVTFSNDGRYILSSSRDGKAIIWLARPWQSPTKEVAKRERIRNSFAQASKRTQQSYQLNSPSPAP